MPYSRAAALTLTVFFAIILAGLPVAAMAHGLQFACRLRELTWGTVLGLWLTVFAVFGCIARRYLPKGWLPSLQALLEGSHTALVEMSQTDTMRVTGVKIVVVAAVSLFIELILIRWQASLFPVFGLYKNYTLLACFCGLGIGYAMAGKRLVLPATLPLLAALTGSLLLLHYYGGGDILSSFFVVPVWEESYVAAAPAIQSSVARHIVHDIPVYGLLILTFLLNAYALIPIGQYAGFLMNRMAPLAGYGCNLAGSVLGVGLLFLLSWQWAGPDIWFTLAVVPLLWLQSAVANARKLGIAAAVFCILMLSWPFTPLTQTIFSPYQTIQVLTKGDGLAALTASGTYYQKIYDFSPQHRPGKDNTYLKQVIGHYELPFRTAASLDRVAVIGAGTGNDVAAALRVGAKQVDAVEIDPVIYQLGAKRHPEHPYDNPNVHGIINDARSFLRQSGDSYDAIVYGVLDSHVLLSHGSNVRLDSFVYTQEGLRDAFAHVKPGGILSVSFALQGIKMGPKIFRMIDNLQPDGSPVAILTGYDNQATTTYIIKKGGQVVPPKNFIDEHSLRDVTQAYHDHNDGTIDLPNDNWPFLYMDQRTFPATYVVSLALVLALSAVLMRNFLPRQKPTLRLAPFFFLGSGFMLVETKAITEFGLLFGNTWHVVGLAIIGVLVMAFFANWLCLRWTPRSLGGVWAGLFTMVALGYLVAAFGGTAPIDSALIVWKALLLVCPLFFSGILFSTLLSDAEDTSGAMAHNLVGAMLGGVLEYNAMEFGFASLYLIALALYAVAWGLSSSPQIRKAAS